jgi:hypothetical protein
MLLAAPFKLLQSTWLPLLPKRNILLSRPLELLHINRISFLPVIKTPPALLFTSLLNILIRLFRKPLLFDLPMMEILPCKHLRIQRLNH